jgi:RimJ/RimL family protein N-acetyltransferase
MNSAVTLHRLEDRPEDAADFRRIRIAALRGDPDAFGETYDSVRGMDEFGWAERLRTLLARPGNAVYIARSGECVIGTACFGLHVEDAACGVMWGVYVAEGHRGTGLAERLIAAGQDWLQSLGIRRIEARVAAPNGRAIAFYRRLGFTIGPANGTLRPGSPIPVHSIYLSLPGVTGADDPRMQP